MVILAGKEIRLMITNMNVILSNETKGMYNAIGKSLLKLGLHMDYNSKKQVYNNKIYSDVERILMDEVEEQLYLVYSDIINRGVIKLLTKIRNNNTLIVINSEYPSKYQRTIIHHLNLGTIVDDWYSYDNLHSNTSVINTIMRNHKVRDVNKVAYVGDTLLDIKRGNEVGCGLVIGISNQNKNIFKSVGADFVLSDITDLEK